MVATILEKGPDLHGNLDDSKENIIEQARTLIWRQERKNEDPSHANYESAKESRQKIIECCKAIVEKGNKQRDLAFTMSQNDRLGANSPASILTLDLAEMVARLAIDDKGR